MYSEFFFAPQKSSDIIFTHSAIKRTITSHTIDIVTMSIFIIS
ncbi:hypothetical protein SA22_4364 [Salmonella enterica subsp. enterica serovar Agona str. 22.H.04]|uniref:Uncharacterized protein n=2 Tax=Salmonella enterica I TaxID=59201 RepID=B5F827_SALA4|nr:hypothetical protein SeAg_B0210 [Salmonella enterica subsp. enterica serovar Agona str. SL483]ETA89175.1 hypothetical protein A628_00799 [Salmonella enterica subsp. enterica serovar Cubana str. 76814]CCR03063.1 hypothetical protein SA73_4307 [Salmonella enterica subsp. enterica serovar Agona str. 73.H.09]CCR07071.1 hypothetical protein SA72_3656 [Salmonella enterica subsp. enterica serovar Agona str. 72.A.52]CCR12303.1 hypothetical protein SA71_4303 [Salmonella enterica subsp. enterica serov